MPFNPPPKIFLTPFSQNGSRNNIPDTQATPGDGLASITGGFPPETQLPINAGGIPPRRPDINGILNLLSTLSYYLGSGPVYLPFSNVIAAAGGYPLGALLRPSTSTDGRIVMSGKEGNTDDFNENPNFIGTSWFTANGIPQYAPGIDHHAGEWVFWSVDGNTYRCKALNGPGYDAGPRAPDDTTYWESIWDYVRRNMAGSSGGTELVYPGAFHDFFLDSPPENWRERNGDLISNASANAPELFEALQTPKFAFALTDETTWMNMRAQAENGIGGAPKFVLNITANTIRLPDTRGDIPEHAGYDGLVPGSWKKDGIRRITGYVKADTGGVYGADAGGAFAAGSYTGYDSDLGSGYGQDTNLYQFDSEKVVPSATKNRPSTYGVLGCVYIGPPSL